MTIASQTSRISYTGDGATTAFPVPFYFQANADIVVYLQDTLGNQTLQVLGTNYNMAGATLAAGGTCTFVAAPTTGYLISIYRDPAVTQTTSYNNNDPFPAKSHELALDKLTTIAQRVKDSVARSIHQTEGEASMTTTLASIAIRKNKLLGFGTNGELIYPLSPTFVGTTATGVAYVDSRATASITTFAGSVNYLETGGLVTPGDGGNARYIRGLVGDPGAFQDGSGVYWKTVNTPRERLTTNRTYFVLKTGNDLNTGTANTAGGAWLTLQHAVDFVTQFIDLAGQSLFIQVGDGTYAENLILTGVTGLGRQAQGSAVIQGNASNHSAVIIQPASGDAVTGVDTLSGWTLKNLQINSTTALSVHADYNSSIYLDGVVLGGSPNIQVQATFSGAFVEFINNPYVVSGTFLSHASAVNGGVVAWQSGATCSFSGTVSVGAGFLQISGGGIISCGAVFNGLTATGAGSAFSIDYGGSLRTSNDPNPNAVLPAGLVAGTVNIWPVQAGISYTNLLSNVRSALGLSLSRATHGDSNYTILPSDAPFIQTAATLTAARTWTLPLSNSLLPSTQLVISDTGGINGANTLTIVRQGSDAFTGVGVTSNSITMSVTNSSITVRNDGVSGWYLVGKT